MFDTRARLTSIEVVHVLIAEKRVTPLETANGHLIVLFVRPKAEKRTIG